MIELRHLDKEYHLTARKTITPLQEVNCFIPENNIIVIQGESGSGKSTLLNLIGGLTRPDHGDIIVDAEKLSEFNDDQLSDYRNNSVGFVFQNYNLIPYLSAEDNIIFSLLLKRWEKVDARKKSHELLKQLDVFDKKDHRPNQMSGGEQQRVAIARAIAHSPKIILADEPTGNLDSRNAQEVLNILREIYNVRKQTIIIASHSEKSSTIATLLFYLKDGKLSQVKL